MRGLIASLASLAIAACAGVDPLEGPPDPVAAAEAFARDPEARRAALEASVAVADTPYARTRLERSAAWDALPEYAPRVRPLRVEGAPGDAAAIAEVDAVGDLGAWERAGADAFERQPAQIDLGLAALRDRAVAERAGLVVTEAGVVRGVVEVETASGWVVALACAACHGAERDGAWTPGLPGELDLGWVLGSAWPRGTVDVTADGEANPVRPSDLRPVASQARLHHAGNVANGRLARMVRIETLLVTQSGERWRPDRRIVAAIELYLESLARALPEPDRAREGAAIFDRTCARCHGGDGLAGLPVPVAIVGTDPAATSGERATGGYRAPSLRGVADRSGVLHDGSASGLEGILGLAPSEHAGHPFGRELPEGERRAIAAFLGAR